MSWFAKTVYATVILVAWVALSGTPTIAQTMLFQNGWDQNGTVGCDTPKITDNSAWNDYGPGSTCSSPRIAEIVTNERVDGTSSLRINFPPDGTQNGPDFRLVKRLGVNHNQMYARWYIKWSNNWVWASADHKIAIFGNASETSQDIYFNIRGNGNGPTGRVVIGVTPSDTVVADPSFVFRPGQWYLCEIRIVSGSNGRVEVRVNGQTLNLVHEAGNQASASNLNTGGGVGYLKLDTTYNAYSYPSGLGLNMNAWYDAVALSTTGWIGGVGTTPPPPPPAPAAPTNVRVIR